VQKVKLGQGAFGTVWRAVHRETNQIVAMKQIDKAMMPRRGVRREDVEREINMMKACQHTNLTRLYDTFEDTASIHLALEYCDGGDFGDKVKQKGAGLTEREASDWMKQILSAIAALHVRSICHRDIKPDNFMVSGDNTLKLTDFGLAIFLPNGKLLIEKCGTPAFMTPEQYFLPKRSRGYGLPVDVWAAGILMYMLMFGGQRHPFVSDSGQLDERMLAQGAKALDFREFSGGGFFGFGATSQLRWSEAARHLCGTLCDPAPARRITAEAALRNAWVLTCDGTLRFADPPASVRTINAAEVYSLGAAPPQRASFQVAPTPVLSATNRSSFSAAPVIHASFSQPLRTKSLEFHGPEVHSLGEGPRRFTHDALPRSQSLCVPMGRSISTLRL